MFEVIIIGAGAGGLSAALWCAELNLKTLLLESENEIGGQLLRVYNRIENHLGTIAADGRELRDNFAAQIRMRNFELRTAAPVASVDLTAKRVFLANGEIFEARFLILATGVSRRKLNIAGEAEFYERGLLESGKRDGGKMLEKTVCIIGGGDAAAENALIMGEFAAKVYLVHRRREFRARAEFLEQIRQNQKIEVLTETEVLQISGTEKIERVELLKSDSPVSFQIAVDAVLIRVGVEPNSAPFGSEIELDAQGYVVVNSLCETSVADVFAVGDVSNPLAPTISGAVGAGATAAKVIAARINL